jgi:hypothetical protein
VPPKPRRITKILPGADEAFDASDDSPPVAAPLRRTAGSLTAAAPSGATALLAAPWEAAADREIAEADADVENASELDDDEADESGADDADADEIDADEDEESEEAEGEDEQWEYEEDVDEESEDDDGDWEEDDADDEWEDEPPQAGGDRRAESA